MLDGTKRLAILLLALLLISTLSFAADARRVNFSSSGNKAELVSNNDFGFELQFRLQEYSVEEIQTKAGVFDQINVDGFGYSGKIGEPKLPVFSKLIAVPIGAEVQVEFLNRNQLSIAARDSRLNHKLIPAQASVSKSDNPELVPFAMDNAAYAKNSFTGNGLFKVEEIGYLRGVRMFRFDYEPIQYNPTTGELQVVSEADIRVNFVNPDLQATKDLLDKTGSVEYDALYGKLLYNWRDGERVNNNRYPTKILILCPPSYTDEMQTFVDWKIQQGYQVQVTTVGSTGTVANTTTAINTYMASVWAAATAENPAPTYLIIVGDTSTTGDNIIANTGVSASHVTDLTYVRLQGTDYLPEMYYGRFSVASATELTNVISKTLTFEKTAMPDLSYLGKVVMIAGADASYAPTYGNGQINYGTTHYFNSTNGLTSNTYLYPASETSDATIIANANEGRGYINYTAHGSETSWADPTFTVSDVNSMTNTNKYGVMVGNCCVTNSFGTSVCFGESIIRKANAGGVAYIGATNNSYWDEDYWWGIGYKTPIQTAAHAYSSTTLGAYDAIFHTHGEAFTNWATTLGEINVMGNTAVEQSTSTRKPYYWEIYSIMGDPSLMPYMGVPTAHAATYPTTILIGATSITVTAAPYSKVALTMGGVIYGTALVPSSGTLNLTITPFSTVGTAKLVITAQNKITVQSNITIAPNTGAYLTVDANTYNDANNSVAEYNETGRFTTTFKNVGSLASGTATATLTCSTAGITITDGTESLASIASGASVVKTNAFSFTTANNMVNGTSAAFTITTVSGSDTWTYNFSQTIAAPILGFGSYTINDAGGDNDGKLDPGETVTVTMPLSNTGAAASPAGTATLSSPTSGITINTGTVNFTAIAASGSTNLSFNISASSGMTIGTLGSLVFNAAAGAYTASKTESVEVGAPTEITIGAGTSSQTYPIDRYYNYSAHEAIYLASEVGAAGTIKSIAFNKASGTDVSTIEAVTIYMKNSSTATLATGTYSTTGYTQVYSGTFPNTATSGWMEVNLNTQFAFDGVSNLHILTVKGNQAYITTYPNWTYTTSSTSRARQAHSDTAAPTSLTSSTNLPNIKLKMFPAVGVLYPAQNLAATSTHGSVTLTWSAPISGTPTGYKIYRNSSLLTTVTGLTYTDTAVTTGSTYSYYVKAAYSSGDADATATVNATPTAAAPQSLAATVSNLVVNLSWSAPTSGTPASYKVYRNSSLLTTVTALSYSDTAVSNGTSYAYYVTAVYSSPTAESAASNTVNATPNATAPTNLTATPGNTLVNLSWTAATGRGEEAIDAKDTRNISGYKVYRNSVAITTVSATTYQDTGLTNGSSYSYYVTTVYSNPAGESAASNTVNATPAVVMEAIIGTGTSATGNTAASPINVYYKSLHGQSVYTAAELTAAGITGPINITQLGFNITNLPTIAMPSFVVRMKHTTATDVASWVDNTNLVTVYSNTSYLPTATGYNMYTLSTPFLWNGTDNILVDTAFGLYTPAYASTGQVQYSTVTNGYRYVRSDTADQTTIFTGGSTATTRPNVKFMFAPVTSNPQISVNQSSIAFGSVAVGAGSTQSFIVTNTGQQDLIGTITTPNGFTVASRSVSTRNSINISIAGGGSQTFNLTFGPIAATAYSGNVVFATNSGTMATLNMAVSGTGYTPPTIAVDADMIAAGLIAGEEGTDSFSISNTGTQALNYTIGVSEVRGRGAVTPSRQLKVTTEKNITGANLTLNISEYSPGTTEDWVFTVTNPSTDTEWIKDIFITFPAGVTVNSASNFVGGDGGDMTPNLTSGTGITINWHGETSSGYGLIQGANDSATATLSVSVPASFSAPMNIAYTLNGDVWGADPHVVESSITLPAGTLPITWFSASPLSGTVAPGGTQTITGSFSAIGMEAGLYEALLSISSNDPVHPLETVQVLMEVTAGNRPPVITLPASFTFEKNGSLIQSFASYISDPDGDPVTLSVTGNDNVTIDINGTTVTFGAAQNWFGTETVTFSLYDGQYYDHENVDIIVTPANLPEWEPVVYPTNPATVYAVVTIDNIPAQLNDMVAAFVGEECRAIGEIVLIDRAVAYTTLVVNLASDDEVVSFKIYAHATDTIYPVPEELPVESGAVYGETEPVPLNGTLAIVLAAPQLAIQNTVSGTQLQWNAVTHANNYKIYACTEPYGTFTYVGSTSSLNYSIDPSQPRMFYKVVAEKISQAKAK